MGSPQRFRNLFFLNRNRLRLKIAIFSAHVSLNSCSFVEFVGLKEDSDDIVWTGNFEIPSNTGHFNATKTHNVTVQTIAITIP
jgi:hypothetical protein